MFENCDVEDYQYGEVVKKILYFWNFDLSFSSPRSPFIFSRVDRNGKCVKV